MGYNRTIKKKSKPHIQLNIYDIFQAFISSGIDFDGEKIKARYLGFDVEKPKMFLEVYKSHNKGIRAAYRAVLSYRTLQKYKLSRRM